METIELNISEHNSLAFDVEITGISTDKVDVRFVVESNNMDLSFQGKMENNSVTVDIPILSNIIKPDAYKGRLEFVLEGEKFFTPVETIVELIQPVSISASVKESNTTTKKPVKETSSPTVTVKRKETIHDKVIDNITALAEAESIDELLHVYSQKVLLKETYVPLNIKEVMPIIDKASNQKFGLSFTDFIKKVK